MVSKMKGPLGTIKSIALHKNLPYLAAVGSDRYLRVYNLLLNKMTFIKYMKPKLSYVLFT